MFEEETLIRFAAIAGGAVFLALAAACFCVSGHFWTTKEEAVTHYDPAGGRAFFGIGVVLLALGVGIACVVARVLSRG